MRFQFCLLLVFYLLLECSQQKTCYQAVGNRMTSGQLFKVLPSYRHIGQTQRSYACTPNTLCFNNPKQFFRYYDLLENDNNCSCVAGFKKECILDADKEDNRGLRSVFTDDQFNGNQEATFSKVVVVFLLKARKIGKTQQILQWYLGTAYPLE